MLFGRRVGPAPTGGQADFVAVRRRRRVRRPAGVPRRTGFDRGRGRRPELRLRATRSRRRRRRSLRRRRHTRSPDTRQRTERGHDDRGGGHAVAAARLVRVPGLGLGPRQQRVGRAHAAATSQQTSSLRHHRRRRGRDRPVHRRAQLPAVPVVSHERVQPVQQSGSPSGAGGHGKAARPTGRPMLSQHHTGRSAHPGLRQRENRAPSSLGLSVPAGQPIATGPVQNENN